MVRGPADRPYTSARCRLNAFASLRRVPDDRDVPQHKLRGIERKSAPIACQIVPHGKEGPRTNIGTVTKVTARSKRGRVEV